MTRTIPSSWTPPPPNPPGETPEQWRDRVLAEHGPPPQSLRDLIRQLASQVAARKERERREGADT